MSTHAAAAIVWIPIGCPHCGERYESPIDLSGGSSSYVEDCAICCRPIVIEIVVDLTNELSEVRVRRDND